MNIASNALPNELVEHIVFLLWSSPLSADNRITFMTSSLLVNKAWMSTFIRISLKDVHIPCPSYGVQYMRTLAGCSPIFDEQNKSLPGALVRSITVNIRMAESDARAPGADEEHEDLPMGKALENLLYELSSCHVPNLQTLFVEYENMGFDDIFDRGRFVSFPLQISNLVISFSFDRAMDSFGDLLRSIHDKQDPYLVRTVYMPGIKQVLCSGASKAFIEDISACCPNKESISSLTSTPLESSVGAWTTDRRTSSRSIEPTIDLLRYLEQSKARG